MEINEDKIQKIISQVEASSFPLHEVKQMLKELINPKWEPKELEESYTLDSAGILLKLTQSYESNRLYGSQWPTRELAETARDMNKRNQLILQAKTEMGYGDGGYVIYKRSERNEWVTSYVMGFENPELTFENREQAKDVIQKLELNG